MSRDEAPHHFRETPIPACCGNCRCYNHAGTCKHPHHEFEVGDYPYEWKCDDFRWAFKREEMTKSERLEE